MHTLFLAMIWLISRCLLLAFLTTALAIESGEPPVLLRLRLLAAPQAAVRENSSFLTVSHVLCINGLRS